MNIKRAKRGVVCLVQAILVAALLPTVALAWWGGGQTEIKDIRYYSSDEGYTRVVIDLTDGAGFEENRILNPDRLYIDLKGTKLPSKKTLDINDGLLKRVRAAQFSPETVRVVFDLGEIEDYRVFILSDPPRVVVDVFGKFAERPVDKKTIVAEGKRAADEKTVARATGVVREESLAEKRAAINRIVEEKRLAKERRLAEEKRLTEEKRIEDEWVLARERRLADERKLAEERKLAGEKRIEEKGLLAKERRLAEEKRLADEKRVVKEKRVAKAKTFVKGSPGVAKERRAIRKIIGVHKVVLDAGHGGRDPGACGSNGLKEKEIVLDIAKRVKKILEAKGGYEVHLTRNRDRYLSLEKRNVIANKHDAELFVSIHANANPSSRIRGLETYFLNFASNEQAMKVAARENRISLKRMKKARSEQEVILASLQLQNNRDESLKLANCVQDSMVYSMRKYSRIKDLGVKQALFYVLFGAKMPSVLVEVSYITNPEEGKRLKSSNYRASLAKGIASGVKKYFDSIPPDHKIAMRR